VAIVSPKTTQKKEKNLGMLFEFVLRAGSGFGDEEPK